MGRLAGLARPLIGVIALAPWPLWAADTSKLDPQLYPPAETFRTLQLEVLACSRENTTDICAKARLLADPLLDHPRLSTACKDVIWSIRQKAQVGSAGDFSRRDAIDKLGRDVTQVCRQQVPPKTETAKPTGAPGGKSFGISMPR